MLGKEISARLHDSIDLDQVAVEEVRALHGRAALLCSGSKWPGASVSVFPPLPPVPSSPFSSPLFPY